MLAGCVQQYGEQSFNVGRNAWLQAGLPYETPATTIDRQCGSAQQAVNFGAALIASGVHDVVIGSGVEHMGRIPMFVGRQFEDVVGSPLTPELLRALRPRRPGVQRRDDRRAVGACRASASTRSARAPSSARSARPTEGPLRPRDPPGGGQRRRRHAPTRASARARRSRRLAELKPAFKEDGVITAGNSSQISDGAAAVLLDVAREGRRARAQGTRARIVDQTTVGVDPVIMLTGPIPATRKILERNRTSRSTTSTCSR